MTVLSIVTAAEIRAEYRLPEWMPDKTTFLRHEGDAKLQSHWRLNWDAGWHSGEFAAQWCHWNGLPDFEAPPKLGGIVITGDLDVAGSIINADYGGGPTLLVKGDTRVRSLVCSGSHIQLMGDCIVSEAVYGYYNHGELKIYGKVSGPIYIQDDHMMSIGINTFFRTGKFSEQDYDVQVAFNRQTEPRWWDDEEIESDEAPVPPAMRKLLLPEITYLDEILPHLVEGRPILVGGDCNRP